VVGRCPDGSEHCQRQPIVFNEAARRLASPDCRHSELVDDKDVVLGSGKRMPNKGGADEPRPSSHQKTLCHRGPVHEPGSPPYFLARMLVRRRLTVNIPIRRPQPAAGAPTDPPRIRPIAGARVAAGVRIAQIRPAYLTAVIIVGHFCRIAL